MQKTTSIISVWFCFLNTPTVYLKTNFVFRFLNYFIIFVITASFLFSWEEFLHFYFRNSIMGHILSKFIRSFRLQFFRIHFLNFLFCPNKLHGQKVQSKMTNNRHIQTFKKTTCILLMCLNCWLLNYTLQTTYILGRVNCWNRL